MKCARCLLVISPEDTVEVYGNQVAHLDCRKPRDLNHEERELLFTYCLRHAVATCPACAQDFQQYELTADPIGNRTHLCPRCRIDLTERLRDHLYDCTMLPGEVRYRAREARAILQRLIKESYEAIDRTGVLRAESEAWLADNRKLLQEVRAAMAHLRNAMKRQHKRMR